MAESARHVDGLALSARPAGTVRVAARAADLVAPDAERLACAGVAARALDRIAPRRASVLVPLATESEPAWRMRAPSGAGRGAHVALRVTAFARAHRVACAAEAGLRSRLGGMARDEAGAVYARSERIVEQEALGQDRDRDAVARRAGPLTVARRAEIA